MFKYKMIKQRVPWCNICNSEIHGNGSMVNFYHCKCGKYEFVYDEGYTYGEYKLKKNAN